MSEDVWSEQDTNPDAIETALRELLRARHVANESLAPARVLNLVVVVDRSWKGEIANRLDRVGRFNPSRTVLCAVEDGRSSLDATAVMSYDESSEASLGVIHESVEIDMGPGHLQYLETIVDPILVSELPTMLWCPHGHDRAIRALRGIIDVMLLDSDGDADSPQEALQAATDMLTTAYVVDLAWLRTTPWRERLAASFDHPHRLQALFSLESLTIRHQRSSQASALLLVGWLSSRLQWDPQALSPANGAGLRGHAGMGTGQMEIDLEAVEQNVPGLAGVTVEGADGFSLSLDRASGGLCAREHSPENGERVWQVLGASRGEGGILGEGVRQALLRDPTYGPALSAARAFSRA